MANEGSQRELDAKEAKEASAHFFTTFRSASGRKVLGYLRQAWCINGIRTPEQEVLDATGKMIPHDPIAMGQREQKQLCYNQIVMLIELYEQSLQPGRKEEEDGG